MKEQEIQEIAQKIICAEKNIELGKDVQLNEAKIETYMKNLSFLNLLKVVMYIENYLDNEENF